MSWKPPAEWIAFRLFKMGDGEAPVVEEFKYLGSMLSKNFDDSVTIMARITSQGGNRSGLGLWKRTKVCPEAD